MYAQAKYVIICVADGAGEQPTHHLISRRFPRPVTTTQQKGLMQIHSLCRHCLWCGSCAAAESKCDDKGVITDPKATAGATDDIDIPWCLDPYDPDALDLVDVDGQWYPAPQAHTIHLIKERIDCYNEYF